MKLRDIGTIEEYADDLMVLYAAYQALEARHAKLLEALKFIVSKENIMFAECTDAEEILLKCKQAIEADTKASEE